MSESVFDHLDEAHKNAWKSWGLDKVRQGKHSFHELSDDEKMEVTGFLLQNYGKFIAYLDDEVEWQFIYGVREYSDRFKKSAQRAVTKACVTFTEKIMNESSNKMARLN